VGKKGESWLIISQCKGTAGFMCHRTLPPIFKVTVSSPRNPELLCGFW